MRLIRCTVGLADGMVIHCDGIEHVGERWLVPEWIATPQETHATPARAIRFDQLPHQASTEPGIDYENIRLPITEAELFLQELPSGIEYQDHPQNLRVRIQEIEEARRRRT